MSRLRRSICAAPAGVKRTPRRARGIERDDDQRVEDDRRQDRRLGLCSDITSSSPSAGIAAGEHRRDDREVLGDVVGDRERRQRAARDQQLLADLDDLDQLRRIGVEVDHVAGLLRRLRAGVHRDADVGLSERRRVVGAVAGHRDEAAAALLLLDQRHLVLRRRLGEEVVDSRLAGDRRGGARVVAGDHHRADPHPAQLVEALAHPRLDDVGEVDDAEHPRRRRRRARRRRAASRPRPRSVDLGGEVGRHRARRPRTQAATASLAPLRRLLRRRRDRRRSSASPP